MPSRPASTPTIGSDSAGTGVTAPTVTGEPASLLHESYAKMRWPVVNGGATITLKLPSASTLPVPIGVSDGGIDVEQPSGPQSKIVMQLLPGVAFGMARPATVVEPEVAPAVIDGGTGVGVAVCVRVGVIVAVLVGVRVAV